MAAFVESSNAALGVAFVNVALGVTMLIGSVGCGLIGAGEGGTNPGGPVTAALEPCDPLGAMPTELGRVVGVGRDASGNLRNLYVGDEQSNLNNRVFVSDGASLRRMHVTGAGRRVADQDADYSLAYEAPDGTNARTLLIQMRAGATTAMELAPANSRGFITDGASGNDHLAPLDPSAIADMGIINLPRVIVDVFDVEDGSKIVVTADMDNGADDVRLFFGPTDHLDERTIVRFGRSHGTSGTSAEFSINGVSAFLQSIGPASGTDATTLAVGNGPVLVARHVLPTPNALPNLTFRCLTQ